MSAHRTRTPTSERPDTEVSGPAGSVSPSVRPDPAADDPTEAPGRSADSGLAAVAAAVTDRPRTEGDPAPTGATPVAPSPDGVADVADEKRMEVSGTQVAASVLASVSAAVIASFFGVAGTIVGTAVVSVVATVGSAAYRLGIDRTQRRLQQLQALQALRLTRPVPLATGRVRSTAPAEATEPTSAGATPSRWRGWLAQRRWGLAAGIAIVFAVSLGTVTLLEVIGDRPLAGESSGGGATSLGSLVSNDRSDDGDDGGDAPEPTTESPVTTVPGDDATTTDGGQGGEDDAAEDGSSVTTPAPDGTGGPTDPTDPATSTTTAPTTPTTGAPDDPATVDPVPTTAPPEVGSSPPAA